MRLGRLFPSLDRHVFLVVVLCDRGFLVTGSRCRRLVVQVRIVLLQCLAQGAVPVQFDRRQRRVQGRRLSGGIPRVAPGEGTGRIAVGSEASAVRLLTRETEALEIILAD